MAKAGKKSKKQRGRVDDTAASEGLTAVDYGEESPGGGPASGAPLESSEVTPKVLRRIEKTADRVRKLAIRLDEVTRELEQILRRS